MDSRGDRPRRRYRDQSCGFHVHLDGDHGRPEDVSGSHHRAAHLEHSSARADLSQVTRIPRLDGCYRGIGGRWLPSRSPRDRPAHWRLGSDHGVTASQKQSSRRPDRREHHELTVSDAVFRSVRGRRDRRVLSSHGRRPPAGASAASEPARSLNPEADK